jgi:hypothetical protein
MQPCCGPHLASGLEQHPQLLAFFYADHCPFSAVMAATFAVLSAMLVHIPAVWVPLDNSSP